MRQSLSAITFSFFSQAVLRSFTIAHIHTYFSSFLSYRNFWRSNTIHWSQQVIRSRGSVTDIFRGDLISSDPLYGRSILTTTSPTTAYGISPTTTHVSVETGSTSVISPTTHRGHEFTWGESFLSPPTCINTRDPWIKKPRVHSVSLCSRTLAFHS